MGLLPHMCLREVVVAQVVVAIAPMQAAVAAVVVVERAFVL
jgi:hypothetical protein